MLDVHNGKSHIDLVVIPGPSLLAFRSKYLSNQVVVCQFTYIRTQSLLVDMNRAFSQITNFPLESVELDSSASSFDIDLLEGNHHYFLFSNYIDSGWFRKVFLDSSCLDEQAIKLRNQGFKLIHIGSSMDLLGDKRSYDFIDIDLRGVLEVSELACLANAETVVGAVTYDNFIMHLIGIFNKRAFVLFRGRFLKRNSELHYNFINPVFFKQGNMIEYLK